LISSFSHRKLLFSIGMLVAGAGLLLMAVLARPGASARSQAGSEAVTNGGTFRISNRRDMDSIDPARVYSTRSWQMAQATCAFLLRYADTLRSGRLRIQPEVSAGWPRVSRDGRTYTFTIRRGFQFNTGERVTARTFAHVINRALNPTMQSPTVTYLQDIVGAGPVIAGTATQASGVKTSGNRLTIRLSRPIPDFPARLTMPFLCAIPLRLAITREGASAPLPSAGPYYVAKWEPGRELVLERNRLYRRGRPHHVDRFVYTIGASLQQDLDRMERGETDYVELFAPGAELIADLRRKYGINRSQFFVKPGTALQFLALNTARPLFRNNARLRRAVNFAIDRSALAAEYGPYAGIPTDQYLLPTVPGFRDAHIYPLVRPDLPKALELARGRTRGGKAVLYTLKPAPGPSLARIVQNNLRRIGIEVEIREFELGVLVPKLASRRERFDIGLTGWIPDYLDQYALINLHFHGREIGRFNYSHFNSPRYNRLMDRAAKLSGDQRARAYGALDVELARNAAPRAAFLISAQTILVGARVGCKVFDPLTRFNLAAACLR
jgi:oligopeptide transport system substrate-binding protein